MALMMIGSNMALMMIGSNMALMMIGSNMVYSSSIFLCPLRELLMGKQSDCFPMADKAGIET